MSDRGFSIHDLCSVKGITLNRPKKGMTISINLRQQARNFNIAVTRIHVALNVSLGGYETGIFLIKFGHLEGRVINRYFSATRHRDA